MREKTPILPGHAVLVVANQQDGTRKTLLGHVTNVGQILPENVGTNGEPTVTAIVLDPTPGNIKRLGLVDWHQGLTRLVGLRHYSHDDVVSGRHANCYVESFDPAFTEGMGLNLDDTSKPVLPRPDGLEENQVAAAAAQDHSGRSVSPLVPDDAGLSQHEAFRKMQAGAVAGSGATQFEPVEVYRSEKTGVSVESMQTGAFCCYDKDEKLITHHTDKGDSTMVFPTKETAIEFADVYEAGIKGTAATGEPLGAQLASESEKEAADTHEATSTEEPAPVS